MTDRYDVIVVGAGLGGLTAAALLAKAGRKTLLIERNYGVGGAASAYKAGDLVVEASLHETADPNNPAEPKHHVLSQLGVLDQVEWVPTGAVYEVRGGPVGEPFKLPDGFAAAQRALVERFPSARAGIGAVLGEMEQISSAMGTLSKGRAAFAKPLDGLSAVSKLRPLISDWRLSLNDRFDRAFGDNEAVKCALAANLPYWADDPGKLWWGLFATAQGGYLGCGGRYIKGGSQRLSNVLAKTMKAAGGELLLRRTVTEIMFDADGRPRGVVHEGTKGGERVEALAPVVVSNAAPSLVADMLPATARERFWPPYAGRPLSISLFSATFGLSARPAEIGFTSYSTFVLPNWMTQLGDYRRCGALLSGEPSDTIPAMVIVDYASIDSGLGGPPYPVSVVGVDQTANWAGLDGAAYNDKRDRWRDAIIGAIDNTFPGFASRVVASVFSTASTMQTYLNAPQGALYGFAPLPPQGP
ncbi:MAG TPA: FAD-dependent oxidoreductase, partial [Hyphomicrobiaceae bacterium]|nr:FAD-dependent oxidoreductase [Hyphomicrobiaceae bacterium]